MPPANDTASSASLLMSMLLQERGVDAKSVHFVQNLDGKLLSGLFAGGMGDYLVVDYPSARGLAASGVGQIVAAMPLVAGTVPWSVYYMRDDGGPAQPDVRAAFVRALRRGMEWISTRGASQYRPFLAETFPRLDPDLTVAIVDTYRASGMWETPRIDRAGFDRWQRAMAAGHIIDSPLDYDDMVDPRPTDEV